MNKYKEYEIVPFTKVIVLKIDPFMSEIIDECNFDVDDEVGIGKFTRQYIGRDDCHIVRLII